MQMIMNNTIVNNTAELGNEKRKYYC